MPGSSPLPIVTEALRLRKADRRRPALDVLDEAMREHRGTHPDFECIHPEFSHWTEPPSPFAELLRQAFAEDIEQSAMVAISESKASDEIERRWEGVIDLFAQRYDLWT